MFSAYLSMREKETERNFINKERNAISSRRREREKKTSERK